MVGWLVGERTDMLMRCAVWDTKDAAVQQPQVWRNECMAVGFTQLWRMASLSSDNNNNNNNNCQFLPRKIKKILRCAGWDK